MNAAQGTLRAVRVLHFVFLFTVILYLWLPSMLAVSPSKELPTTLITGIGVVALTSAAAVIFFKAQRVRPAAERLRLNPEDKQAALQWRMGLMLCFVFSETIVLFGLVLRIFGVPWKICGIFYAVGALMLILCTPKLKTLPE